MARHKILLLALAVLIISAGPIRAYFITDAVETDKYAKIRTDQIIVWVPINSATVSTGITVTNRVGMVLFQESRPFDFKTGGVYYNITGVTSWSVSGDKVTLNCSTNQTGRTLKLTISFISPKAFRALFEPGSGSSIDTCRSSFAALPTEHFYGLGEPRIGTLDLRGKSVRIWIDKGHPEQTCLVSFMLSSRGYGVWVDSYADGTFDVVDTNTSACKVLWPGSKLSFYVFAGPEFSDIIDQYTSLTGRPPMPPKWQFGLAKWLRPQGADKNAILQDIQNIENNGIPLSYTWIEPQWETQLNSLTFRTDIFPDPAGFIQGLHNRGYKVGAWLRADIFEDSPNYSEALNSKHFVMDSTGNQWISSAKDYDYYTDLYAYRNRGFVDYTDTDAVPWWNAQIQNTLSYGFDGYKIDRGYEIDGTCKFQNGESGAVTHNKYGYWTSKTHFDYLTQKKGNDFFIMHKAESAGSQAFVTLHWSGDQEGTLTSTGLLSGVIGVQSCALTGFPFWTSDIGGWYTDNPSKEVFVRWTEFSAFTPAMETLFGPWQFDTETINIFRYYTKLHYELIPYIYSLAYQSHISGQPIVRPLVYHFRTDRTAQTKDTQFMLGPYLLVSPVLSSGATSVNVYLPRGRWIDFWDSSRVYEGPTTVTVSAPINGIPAFILSGAVIPMEVKDSECSHGTTAQAGALSLDLYPDGDSSFTHYEDNLPKQVTVSFSYPSLRVTVPSLSRKVYLRMMTYQNQPQWVKLNGSTLSRYTSRTSFDSANQGWFYESGGRLWVKYPANTAATVEAGW